MTESIDPRPKILDRLSESGHLAIEASAGTGKTYTLESLVVERLATGRATIDQILIVTFTEKATEELRGRLRRRLETLARHHDTGWSHTETERERLARAANDFDSCTLLTIHGFCSKVLTENAFLQRRLFEESLVDGPERFRRTFRQILRCRLADPGTVGQELRTAIASGASIASLEDLSGMLATFRGSVTPCWDPARQRLAAKRLLDRLSAIRRGFTQAIAERYSTGTQSAAEKRFARLERGAERLAGDGLSFEEAKVFLEWPGGPLRNRPFLDLLRSLQFASRDLRDRREQFFDSLEELESTVCTRKAFLAQRLAQETERVSEIEKAIDGEHDFDDLLRLLRDALRSTSGPELVQALRERYQFALIDEFQDTDEVQWEIFRHLFFDAGDQHQLCVIGDPKQAIYGFRNADVETYRRALEQLTEAGGQRVHLTQNFRSTPALIAVQNALFPEFFDGGIEYRSVTAGQPKRAVLAADGSQAPPVGLFAIGNADDLREHLPHGVAREILRIVRDGALRLRFSSEERPASFADIQVLTRTRREAETIGAALDHHGIPFVLYGQDGLYESVEAQEISALFRALAHPDDPACRAAVLLTPFFDVPLRDLETWVTARPETGSQNRWLQRLYRWHHLAQGSELATLFATILGESGVLRRARFLGNASRRVTNYRHLFEDLIAAGERLGDDARELMDRFARLRASRGRTAVEPDQQRLDQLGDSVHVLTLHKAKGLEAPIVFIYGGWTRDKDGLRIYHRNRQRYAHIQSPPTSLRPYIEAEARAEAQRLAYVGVTRASHRLYLPLAGEREQEYRPHRHSFYAPLHQRLEEIRGGPHRAHFVTIPLSDSQGPEAALDLEELRRFRVEFQERPPSAWSDAQRLRLRQRHAAVVVTSYTQIAQEERGESIAEEGPPAPVEGEFPGGRASGIFLHAVLEMIDLSVVRAAQNPEELFANPAVRRRFEAIAEQHRVPSRNWEAAQRLVWAGLRSEVHRLGLELPSGLAAVERCSRELEFLFPIPPLADSPPTSTTAPFPVGAGYVQGVIDLLFESKGRFFVLDWKSDRLERWDRETLDRHVSAHYSSQARLYGVALLRQLGISTEPAFERHFGGILYCFLRGMDRGQRGRGVFSVRPTWSEAQGWLDHLASWIPTGMESTP